MSEHRIAEIKKWLKGNYVLKAEWSVKNNIAWLISEIEIAQRKLQIADDNYTMLEMQLAQSEDFEQLKVTENKELNVLFAMQRKRTKRAEKMWQEATGNHNALPDLGVLFDWLMAEIAELKENNSECEDRFKLMESDRDYGLDEIKRLKAELDKG